MNHKIELQLDIQNAIEDAELPERKKIEAVVATTLSAAKENLTHPELTLRIVDNDESYALNKTYRGKARPTNVLSFPAELPPEIPCQLLGDIVICWPVLVAEASAQQKAIHDHFLHLVVHGVLHLLGFDHIDEKEAEHMEALEIKILEHFGIENPYLS
jgi:probable rRNA maturation factor